MAAVPLLLPPRLAPGPARAAIPPIPRPQGGVAGMVAGLPQFSALLPYPPPSTLAQYPGALLAQYPGPMAADFPPMTRFAAPYPRPMASPYPGRYGPPGMWMPWGAVA